METDQLRSQLKDLHKALKTAADPAGREHDALSHIMTDIVRVASGEDLHPEDAETLREQIEHQASDFELRHPKTAGILREITDILARLGI